MTDLREETPAPEAERPADAVAPARALPASKGRGWGLLAALLLGVLAKGKSLLVLLKALPASKMLVTSLSMFAMVAVEAQRSGLWFALGFVLMILVHELGHGYAMKRCGVAAGWPIFIPFVGAMIALKGEVRDRNDEAAIAYGGPVAGTAAALAAAALGLATGSRLFFALAFTGFMLNLFNLTPISPLDGGRVAQAFSARAWIVGAAVLLAMVLLTGAPQLLLIAFFALPRLFGKGDGRDELTPELRRAWAVKYFGLASFLGLALYFSSQLMR